MEMMCIDYGALEKLKKEAFDSKNKRARTCLHDNHADIVQQMIIAVCRDSYIQPHRQKNKNKSYTVIEGEALVIFFDLYGKKLKMIHMGMAQTNHVRSLRYNSGIWHTVLTLSDVFIYVETISGPYRTSDTEYAEWAPQSDNLKESIKYMRFLVS